MMNSGANETTAAAKLTGLELKDGWKVIKPLERSENATGGMFSHSYVVEKDKKIGFLKAFDFSVAFEAGKNTADLLRDMTSSFIHERDILEVCRQEKLSKVVIALEHGEIHVPDMSRIEGSVLYLIFELADGDIRGQVDETKRLDTLWSLRALKDVCLGLFQVHKQMIAHQDMKPSNVLIFQDEGFRIADFGQSSRAGHNAIHDKYHIAGDTQYAPPELHYGLTHPDFTFRRFGCDFYMLGNLAAFMFSGTNMTASIFGYLDKQFYPPAWSGKPYEQVLPYIQEAFTKVLEELKATIDPVVSGEVTDLIRELCNPDIARRGHPKGLGKHDQYSLERYVTYLDVLLKRTELKLKYLAASENQARKAG